MGRVGTTWVASDRFMGAIIPSLIFGYATVYESGYTVSFGVGIEWEILLGKSSNFHSNFFRDAYYGITKVPLTGELSIGWMW
jgi:hypothetical protein